MLLHNQEEFAVVVPLLRFLYDKDYVIYLPGLELASFFSE